MLSFDHVGIVTPSLEIGIAELKSTLPIVEVSQRFDDYQLGVSVQFVKDRSGVVFESIAPLGLKSPVSRVAAKERNWINQLAYRCDDLAEEGGRLRASGLVPLGTARPALAFDGAPVQFFWSKAGLTLELIQGRADSRRYTAI